MNTIANQSTDIQIRDVQLNDIQLSDDQRRTICRLLFIVACVIPTAWVTYLLLHPETTTQWQQLVRSQTGLIANIGAVESPGPRWRVLRDVTIHDPQLGELLNATEVEIVYGSTNHMLIKNQSIELTASALQQLAKNIAEHALVTQSANPWRVRIDKAVITNDSNTSLTRYPESVVIAPLELDIAAGKSSTIAEMRFHVSGDQPDNWMEFALEHANGSAPETSAMALKTGTGELPLWMVSRAVPDLRLMGAHCKFTGRLRTLPTNQKMKTEIVGVFREVDLSSVVADTGHTLEGSCTANVKRFVLNDGRISELEFDATCKQGVAGLDLLRSLGKHLDVQLARNYSSSRVGFQLMNFNCQLSEGEFRISNPGFQTTLGDNVAYDLSGKPMLISNADLRNSVQSLFNAMIQPNTDPKIVSQEANSFLERFQLPSVADAPPTRVAREAIIDRY